MWALTGMSDPSSKSVTWLWNFVIVTPLITRLKGLNAKKLFNSVEKGSSHGDPVMW